MSSSDGPDLPPNIATVLYFLDLTHAVTKPRDKHRTISAFATYCVLDSLRRHCSDLLQVGQENPNPSSDDISDALSYSRTIQKVITFLLPIVAEETNLATFQECLRVLQCGMQYLKSVAKFVELNDMKGYAIQNIEMVSASCRNLEKAANQLVLYRSLELFPKHLSTGDSVDWKMVVIHTHDNCDTMRRTSNSMLCAVEALDFIVSTYSAGDAQLSSLSQLMRQAFDINCLSSFKEYLDFVSSEPFVEGELRSATNNSPRKGCNSDLNWRIVKVDEAKKPKEYKNQADSMVTVASYFQVLLNRCTKISHESISLAEISAKGSAQEKLKLALHRAIFKIFEVRIIVNMS